MSLQLPYTNEENFSPSMVLALIGDHLSLTFCVVTYRSI